jgi:outer membrane autotransporter protein
LRQTRRSASVNPGIARNLAVIEAGISTPVTPEVSFGITYSGQLGGGTVDQGVSGNLDWRF